MGISEERLLVPVAPTAGEKDKEPVHMHRPRKALAALVVACVLALVPAAPAQAGPARTMLAKVNSYRVSHGVPRLHRVHSLTRSARSYAHWMLRHQFFGHDNHIHVSRHFRFVGEVLAYHTGRFPGVKLMFDAWKNSPEHAAILLDRTYVDGGFGFAEGRLNGRPVTVWVGHLARR
jgi:uncharacterized protein YkwD